MLLCSKGAGQLVEDVVDDCNDATNQHMPPYFGGYAWTKQNYPKVLRDGDVCVCVGAKSGTTWLLNIVHQIRTLGDPEEFLKHNTHTTRWIDFLRFPGETSGQALEALIILTESRTRSIRFECSNRTANP